MATMTETETLGDWLRQLRQRRGLTQRELARTLGVSVGTIKRWEGDTSYPVPIFRRVLATLGRDVGLGPLPPPAHPSKRWMKENGHA
jgi:transcriptional regulator with XRE-family HTH domain